MYSADADITPPITTAAVLPRRESENKQKKRVFGERFANNVPRPRCTNISLLIESNKLFAPAAKTQARIILGFRKLPDIVGVDAGSGAPACRMRAGGGASLFCTADLAFKRRRDLRSAVTWRVASRSGRSHDANVSPGEIGPLLVVWRFP